MHTTQIIAYAALLLLAAISARAQTSINSFETEADMKMLHARDTRIEQVSTHAADGVHALKVEFLPSEWPNVLFTPSAPWDWSGTGGLALDVTNPTRETLTFSIRIDDDVRADGVTHCRTATGSLEPGKIATFLVVLGPDPMSV